MSQRGILYPQKLALTSTSGGLSVGIVSSRTQAMDFQKCVCRKKTFESADKIHLVISFNVKWQTLEKCNIIISKHIHHMQADNGEKSPKLN
jgi:hypothetical protein